MLVAILMAPLVVSAQAPDTTARYPWRMSYFPYFTVSPNDGLMGLGRVVFFRQSRWDDRVSLTDEVAVEGGYSTKDAWLARVKGDFPRIAPGWRLQVVGEAGRYAAFDADADPDSSAGRRELGLEISRAIAPRVYLALRGDYSHLDYRELSEHHRRARIALVIDRRDREYDTRSGGLLQAGLVAGKSSDRFSDPSSAGGVFEPPRQLYTAWYVMAAGWLPVGTATRLTGRIAFRDIPDGHAPGIEGARTIPAWEDEIVALGGPQTVRALPVGARANLRVFLGSIEVRHDILVFPAGAVALLGFVDAGKSGSPTSDDVTLVRLASARARSNSDDWIIGPGGGIAIRLLRNAVLTSTVGFAEGKARFYVSSGWSW